MYVDPMATRLTCCFRDGACPHRYRGPAFQEWCGFIPPAALIATFAITVWLGRKINSKFVLHGMLIGIVGTLMYVALTRAKPEPWQYRVAHALKVVGGAAGGMVLARRQTAGTSATSGVESR